MPTQHVFAALQALRMALDAEVARDEPSATVREAIEYAIDATENAVTEAQRRGGREGLRAALRGDRRG